MNGAFEALPPLKSWLASLIAGQQKGFKRKEQPVR